MKTTLLTAVGSASASSVIAQLKALGHLVIGCDIYPQAWNAASNEVDTFFQAVLATDRDAYIRQMEEAVKREQVNFLIPLTDVEVDVLCSEKARFAALGCTLCTPDEPAVRLCRNKLDMAQELSGTCLTIPTVSPYGREPLDSEFPIMLKPVNGRSSQGQVIARSREQYLSALSARPDYIAQPFIEGDIFTVDVARDLYGNVQCLCRQELLRTINGLGTTVRILPGHPLEKTCAAIAAQAGIVGVVNMEFIGRGDEYYFLEVNPRFSGGVGFSIAAGVDFAALEIASHEGESIGQRAPVRTMTITRRVQPFITEIERRPLS